LIAVPEDSTPEQLSQFQARAEQLRRSLEQAGLQLTRCSDGRAAGPAQPRPLPGPVRTGHARSAGRRCGRSGAQRRRLACAQSARAQAAWR
jgi:hypothetical protein